VSLAGVRDSDALLSAIAAAMGVEDDADPLDAAIARRLHARPTLLVLDNFEQLVDAAPTIEALLERAPHTRALATSQLPLRLARERLLRLGPLAPGSAAALFHERAAAAAPDYEASEHEQAVEAICARVDGMPLAVELAAARVATLAPAELLARLDRSHGVLARGPRDLAERHRSLRAALEWTHALLEPDEQALLARLAAFAGPAPLDAVEAVAEVAGERGPVDTIEALSGLIDASFVQRTDSREHGVRYTVPQAVRDFAAEQLSASREESAVRAVHAAHVAAVAETFRGVGTPDPAVAQVLALEAEFRAALAWTREHAPALHTRVAAALGLVLNDRGRAREAHTELGLAIERSGITDATTAWAAVVRAFTAIALGSTSETPLMDAGLAVLRAAGDTRRYGLALRVAGVYWNFAEQPERALEHTSEALALARGRSHPGDLALALVDHAQVLIELARLDEAEALLDEAAPLLPQLGASDIDADTPFDALAAARGDWARAVRLFLANAQAAQRNPGLKGMYLRHAAIALAHLGADENAVELAATANAICESIGEAPSDPLTTRYGQALDNARERLGAERAARAARRGAALSEAESLTRAAEMVQAA
jgi:predicted ATPase